MSKITFRADDDLVDAVEGLDESKSEVMRDALRAYLERHDDVDAVAKTLDDVVAERVDELVADRLGSREHARDVNVNITVDPGGGSRVVAASEGASSAENRGSDSPRSTDATLRSDARTGTDTGSGNATMGASGAECPQCGASVAAEHEFCPNCGGAATRRLFCECGDEIRADWAFCPHCGRRTAAANALDR